MIKKPKIVIVGISGESVFLETDHFHRSGETITAINKVTEPGGKGYNQAVASCKRIFKKRHYRHYCLRKKWIFGLLLIFQTL